MLKDFKAFIMKGNVVDMAVGVIIGAAFGAIIGSLVKDVVMPPIGLALGRIDFSNLAVMLKEGSTPGPYASVAAAQAAGAAPLPDAPGCPLFPRESPGRVAGQSFDSPAFSPMVSRSSISFCRMAERYGPKPFI